MNIRKTLVVLFLCYPFFASADISYVAKPFTLPSGLIYWAVAQVVEVDKAHAGELDEVDIIKNFITFIAQLEGGNPEHYIQLAFCESRFNISAYGDKGKSYGLFQWQVHSWAHYNDIFDTNYERDSWKDQTRLTVKVGEKYGTLRDWTNCTQFIKYGTWDKTQWK